MIALIGGILFLVLAVVYFTGTDKVVEKEYRELPGRMAWQRRAATLLTVIGIAVMTHYFLYENQMSTWLVDALAVIAAILIGISEKKFKGKR